METLDRLRRKLDTVEHLHAIVKTMKALAAVGLRQSETAAAALRHYTGTVERGLQAVLRDHVKQLPVSRAAPRGLTAVIFGSDQGMCGQFNDLIASHASERISRRRQPGKKVTRWAVGMRAAVILRDAGDEIESVFEVPGSVAHITAMVQQLVLDLDTSGATPSSHELWLFYHTVRTGAGYGPVEHRVLPADAAWLRELAGRRWPTHQVPMCGGDWRAVYSALVQQYLFTSLYQATLESMLSEQTARLAAMQAAERNVEDTLAALQFEYHQSRQSAITDELLDIVSGVEALSQSGSALSTPTSASKGS